MTDICDRCGKGLEVPGLLTNVQKTRDDLLVTLEDLFACIGRSNEEARDLVRRAIKLTQGL